MRGEPDDGRSRSEGVESSTPGMEMLKRMSGEDDGGVGGGGGLRLRLGEL